MFDVRSGRKGITAGLETNGLFARFLRNRESGILIFYFQLLRYVLHRKLEHFSTNACTEVNVTVLIIRHGCDGVPSLSAYMMDTLLI